MNYQIEKLRHIGADIVSCDCCNGKGYVYIPIHFMNNIIPVFKRCKYCEGSGEKTLTDLELAEEIQDRIDSMSDQERDDC